MGYSLREDSKVPSKGDMVTFKEELDEQLRYYQFIVSSLSHLWSAAMQLHGNQPIRFMPPKFRGLQIATVPDSLYHFGYWESGTKTN